MADQPKNPLHGITLATILDELLAAYGWDGLSERINVRCFTHDPSVKSSLTFFAPHAVGAHAGGDVVFVSVE